MIPMMESLCGRAFDVSLLTASCMRLVGEAEILQPEAIPPSCNCAPIYGLNSIDVSDSLGSIC